MTNLFLILLTSFNLFANDNCQVKSKEDLKKLTPEQRAKYQEDIKKCNLTPTAPFAKNDTNLQEFVDRKYKYTLMVPKDWRITQKDEKNNVVKGLFQTVDNSASIQVMLIENAGNDSLTVMNQVDASQKRKSLLQGEEATVAPEIMNQDWNRIRGKYKIEGKGPGFPVIQWMYYFTKNNKTWIVSLTYQEKLEEKFLKLEESILKTFLIQ